MLTATQRGITLPTLLVVGGIYAATVGGQEAKKLPPIYDTSADGARQVAEALEDAKRDNKRVLLQFGANWCIWCHRLHQLFDENEAIGRKLESEYELVLVDVDEVNGERHNDAIDRRYGRPTRHGLPVLVVLDADGRQLTTQSTTPFEVGDEHDPEKILTFLEQWRAPAVSADAKLSGAMVRAKAASKNVFLWFGAEWCGYCKKMEAWLAKPEVAAALGRAYVPVKVDVDRMSGGEKLAKRFGQTEEDGLPFFVILDADGAPLADSRADDGNVGFPVEPHEIAYFIETIRKTATSLDDDALAALKESLAG